MADSQDKLTPADEKKLAELTKQINQEEPVNSGDKEAKPTQTSSAKSSSPKLSQTDSTTTSKKVSSNGASSEQPNPTRSSNGPLWLFTIINTLLLAAIVVAGYWGWTQWQGFTDSQQQKMTEQQASIQTQQRQIGQTLAASQTVEQGLAQQNQALQTSIQSLIEQVQVTSEQVRTNQQNLADVSGRRPSDWLLAEADYLVRMAGRKLWLENDVNTAIMMLESADIRLQDLNDPSLLPIRQKLADDIQVLQQVNPVSIDSIALQIGALVKQVNPLPLAFFKKPESEQPVDVQQASGWRENLARNWQQVTQDFFSVKRKTAEIKPFMSEQEQWLAKQQLSFALLQGQVAVLRENQPLFQQFLANALGLTQAFFDLEQTSVQQFIKQLSELQNIQINREYPDQFSAVPLLQNTIDVRLDNRFKSTPVEPASATSEAPAQGQPEPSEALGEPQEEASQL